MWLCAWDSPGTCHVCCCWYRTSYVLGVWTDNEIMVGWKVKLISVGLVVITRMECRESPGYLSVCTKRWCAFLLFFSTSNFFFGGLSTQAFVERASFRSTYYLRNLVADSRWSFREPEGVFVPHFRFRGRVVSQRRHCFRASSVEISRSSSSLGLAVRRVLKKLSKHREIES